MGIGSCVSPELGKSINVIILVLCCETEEQDAPKYNIGVKFTWVLVDPEIV